MIEGDCWLWMSYFRRFHAYHRLLTTSGAVGYDENPPPQHFKILASLKEETLLYFLFLRYRRPFDIPTEK